MLRQRILRCFLLKWNHLLWYSLGYLRDGFFCSLFFGVCFFEFWRNHAIRRLSLCFTLIFGFWIWKCLGVTCLNWPWLTWIHLVFISCQGKFISWKKNLQGTSQKQLCSLWLQPSTHPPLSGQTEKDCCSINEPLFWAFLRPGELASWLGNFKERLSHRPVSSQWWEWSLLNAQISRTIQWLLGFQSCQCCSF